MQGPFQFDEANPLVLRSAFLGDPAYIIEVQAFVCRAGPSNLEDRSTGMTGLSDGRSDHTLSDPAHGTLQVPTSTADLISYSTADRL